MPTGELPRLNLLHVENRVDVAAAKMVWSYVKLEAEGNNYDSHHSSRSPCVLNGA